MPNTPSFDARLANAAVVVNQKLLAARNAGGVWVGRLSSSALSTATAVSALSIYLTRCNCSLRSSEKVAPSNSCTSCDADNTAQISLVIAQGIGWIKRHQNSDGGWGDTDRSLSNVATTLLVKSALLLAAQTHISQLETDDHGTIYGPLHDSVVAGWSMTMLSKADAYLVRYGSTRELSKRYGDDRSFAAPILANAAMAGLVDWKDVPPLPFELAVLPQRLFRFLNLPVVSYAIPALVAIGQVQFFHEPSSHSLLPTFLRRMLMERTRRVVESMLPEDGGFLEAIPLTAFVVMAFSEMGLVDSPVVSRGVRFLLETARNDGSWPIDVNLSTWLTTLAVVGSQDEAILGDASLRTAILASQWREPHPFTGAEPGGWGWTPLSGAVPDSDDTAGAVLALSRMRPHTPESEVAQIDAAAENGLRWLFRLQNRDGGIPTFCRGWGRLAFDRSSVDLTAHALRAYVAWCSTDIDHDASIRATLTKLYRHARRAIAFLLSSQQDDGSFIPLWFGNEHRRREDNPYYGTAKVLVGLAAVLRCGVQCGSWPLSPSEKKPISDAVARGVEWLVRNRNEDGGWGRDSAGRSSIEETSVVIEALATVNAGETLQSSAAAALEGGLDYFVRSIEEGRLDEATPIGLYFAKLWYYEDLYPTLFAQAAISATESEHEA
ncbi:MAG: prenyltransferase/squalene oxidase repeat-containing protein [Thermoguttaceae bacterium]